MLNRARALIDLAQPLTWQNIKVVKGLMPFTSSVHALSRETLKTNHPSPYLDVSHIAVLTTLKRFYGPENTLASFQINSYKQKM